MGKKAIKKEFIEPRKDVIVSVTAKDMFDMVDRLIKLEQRIDRIVDAIDKSKKVRGL